MLDISFLLQSKSSRVAVPRNRYLAPLSISILILHVSQTRCHFRNRGLLHGAWTATPVRALQGTYISADRWALVGLGNVIDFGPLYINTLEWWMRATAAPGTPLITVSVTHFIASLNHFHIIIEALPTVALFGTWWQARRRGTGRWQTRNRLWLWLWRRGGCWASFGKKRKIAIVQRSSVSLITVIRAFFQNIGLLEQSAEWKR